MSLFITVLISLKVSQHDDKQSNKIFKCSFSRIFQKQYGNTVTYTQETCQPQHDRVANQTLTQTRQIDRTFNNSNYEIMQHVLLSPHFFPEAGKMCMLMCRHGHTWANVLDVKPSAPRVGLWAVQTTSFSQCKMWNRNFFCISIGSTSSTEAFSIVDTFSLKLFTVNAVNKADSLPPTIPFTF